MVAKMKVDLRQGAKMKQKVKMEVDVEVAKNAKGDLENNLVGKCASVGTEKKL
jgi:hypothetical protein